MTTFPEPADLHTRVLDRLGQDIASGVLAPGTVLSMERLGDDMGVSRSVLREALRVLGSLGFVSSRRKVGTVVMPMTRWNLFDPNVIRWRLAGQERISQLRSLTELREAVEPMAAGLAAARATTAQRGHLVSLAGRLWEAGTAEARTFLTLDIEFHDALLTASGNPMFRHLSATVTEILQGRTRHGLAPALPDPEALQDHVDVATAVQRGDARAAREAMTRIVRRTNEEMELRRYQPASPLEREASAG